MGNTISLSKADIDYIKKLAWDTRKNMGVSFDVPITEDLPLLLEKEGIIVCEYPFSDNSKIDANLTIFKQNNDELVFIGLNSNLYYDDKIFALAHEYYHYLTRTGMVYNTEIDEEDRRTEKMADRYAAELLMPGYRLSEIIENSNNGNLNHYDNLRILRFIAYLQIEWRAPYRCIVLRLFEEGYIDYLRKDQLMDIDCRNEKSVYRKISNVVDSCMDTLLNSKSQNRGISSYVLEKFIRNFEDDFISEQEFIELLRLFGKKPDDFGLSINFTSDDELDEFMQKREVNEP